MTLDSIPREDLVSILFDCAWYSAGHRLESDGGYSYDVNEETAERDVLYRGELLYATPEEALLAHWKRHYSKEPVA